MISDVCMKFSIGAKEPEYVEVRKCTSFGGADQRRAEMDYLGIMVKQDLVEEVIEVK